MHFFNFKIEFETKSPIDLVVLTDQVKQFVAQSGLSQGLLVISTQHTTSAVAINEKCSALKKDLITFLQKLAPSSEKYEHNKIASDGRDNAHSHLLGFLMSHSETITVSEGKLNLGTWQDVFFIELDGPRLQRQVHLTLIGI